MTFAASLLVVDAASAIDEVDEVKTLGSLAPRGDGAGLAGTEPTLLLIEDELVASREDDALAAGLIAAEELSLTFSDSPL